MHIQFLFMEIVICWMENIYTKVYTTTPMATNLTEGTKRTFCKKAKRADSEQEKEKKIVYIYFIFIFKRKMENTIIN